MWKTISINENYEVNEFGDVRYKNKSVLKKQHLNKKNGYMYVQLWDSEADTNRRVAVHRLVATAFIPNADNKPTVDHINGIRTDNSVSNLRWATYLEQNTRFGGVGIRSISVKATHLDGNILYFKSISKTAEYFNVTRRAIGLSISHNRYVKKGNTKGWLFEYDK